MSAANQSGRDLEEKTYWFPVYGSVIKQKTLRTITKQVPFKNVDDALKKYLQLMYCKENDEDSSNEVKKKREVKKFIDNIEKLYNDKKYLFLFDKSLVNETNMEDIKKFRTWLLTSNHNIDEWNLGKKSSFVPQRNNGVAWIDYKFGNINTRVFLYIKKYNKKKFKKYPNIKYIMRVRKLHDKLDVLYFNTNIDIVYPCIIYKKKKKEYLFRENKPLFSGETYNQEYTKCKSTNPFVNYYN